MSYYGTVEGGDAYFALRLFSEDWENADPADKVKALNMATQMIDGLNFAGVKADTDQELEFPRGSDTEVPDNIIKAAYEISIKLLSGESRETALSKIGVTSNSWGTVKQTYDADRVPEWLLSGIPSAEAWVYLRPFLNSQTVLPIRRVS